MNSLEISLRPEQVSQYYKLIITSPLSLKSDQVFKSRFPLLNECECFKVNRTYRNVLDQGVIEQIKQVIPEKKVW